MRQAEKHWPMQLREVRAEETEQQCLPSAAEVRQAEKHWPMQLREVRAEDAELQRLPSVAVPRHRKRGVVARHVTASAAWLSSRSSCVERARSIIAHRGHTHPHQGRAARAQQGCYRLAQLLPPLRPLLSTRHHDTD